MFLGKDSCKVRELQLLEGPPAFRFTAQPSLGLIRLTVDSSCGAGHGATVTRVNPGRAH